MRCVLAAMLGFVLVAAPAVAQTPAPPSTAEADPDIDAGALGISLSRIARRLAVASDARTRGDSPLKLDFRVDVYGTAPRLRFFADEDLVFGGVPGSAPTHRDMMRHVTPQAFRSPRADVLGVISGVAMYGARRVQDWNYDRQYEEYRKRIEAGENATPPKPPK